MASQAAAERVGPLQPRVRTAVFVAGGVLAVLVVRNVFLAAHQVLGWAVAAALLALCIAPMVRGLDRVLPRPIAAVVSFLLLIGAIVGVSWLYSAGIRNEVGRLQDRGPEIAQQIEQRDDEIGAFAVEIGLSQQVTDITERLADGVGSGGDSLRDAAISAPPYLITMILTIFLLIYGSRLVRGGLEQLAERRRSRLDGAIREAVRRAQIYIGSAVVQAAVSGAAVFGTALVVDAPAPGLLALFAATLAMLPYLGIVLGWSPLLMLSVGLVPLPGVLLVACIALALQCAEGFGWRRFVDDRSLHLGPVIPLATSVIGFAVYGIGGAVCATGVGVLAIAMIDQLGDGEPIPTPVDEMD